MKTEFNLREFLVSGFIGPVKCGLTKEDIIARLGPPTLYEMYNGNPLVELLKYEALEIRLENGYVGMYGLYFGWNDRVPDCLNPTGYFPTDPNTLSEFRDYLIKESISFKERGETQRGWRFFTEGQVGVVGSKESIGSLIFVCPKTVFYKQFFEDPF